MPITAVASPLGDMDASGTGIVQAFNYTNAAHSGITHVFTVNASATHDVFKAFKWYDNNTEGSLDASSGNASVTVTLDQGAFAQALAALMANAQGGYVGTTTVSLTTSRAAGYSEPPVAGYSGMAAYTSNVRDVLDREVRKEVENELDNNGVLEYLEGDSLGQFQLGVDYSGGAIDMAGKLADDSKLRNLFFQFPNRDDAVGVLDASGGRLPVISGDSVGFVFNISPAVEITEVPKNPEVADTTETPTSSALASGTTTATAAGLNIGAVSFTTSTRKAAFVIKVTA
jgi:hypothetical protein